MQDGTWGTVEGSFTVIRDFMDVCYHSYFSIMDDLLSEGKYYEIRFVYGLSHCVPCLLTQLQTPFFSASQSLRQA